MDAMSSQQGLLVLEPFKHLLQTTDTGTGKKPSWTDRERYDAVRAIRQKLDKLVEAEKVCRVG
jgi:hypothetical protein